MTRNARTLASSIVGLTVLAGVAAAAPPAVPGTTTAPDGQQPADDSGRNGIPATGESSAPSHA